MSAAGLPTAPPRWWPGQRVLVDGDASVRCVVAQVLWDGTEPQYQLGWWHEGSYRTEWFREWRLSAADPDDRGDPPRGTWPRVGS